jgi:DNA-directed RNA polymerase subunit RPC12/RpoP
VPTVVSVMFLWTQKGRRCRLGLDKMEDVFSQDTDVVNPLKDLFEMMKKAGDEDCEDCEELTCSGCGGKLDTIFGTLPLEVECKSCGSKYLLFKLLAL